METELKIKGICISRDVISTIVTLAVEKVEGVAHVGQDIITSSLISVFSSAPQESEAPVRCEVVDDALHITIHLAVFFGYQFTELADSVRSATARAIAEQVGVEVGAVDVCIDNLVFPKE